MLTIRVLTPTYIKMCKGLSINCVLLCCLREVIKLGFLSLSDTTGEEIETEC